VGALLCSEVHFRFVAHALRDALCGSLPAPVRELVVSRSSVRAASLGACEVAQAAGALRGACSKPIMAVAAGRIVASKRMHLAIEAANLMHERVHLHVLGDGPELARVRRLDRRGNISFGGQVRRQEALAWIAAADVLVHPSQLEAAPTVVREARSLGTPVVACAAGDLARWASGDPGIVLVAPSAPAIASGVVAACGV
jgi:glycosyltransferase involved in cell wall biosynthesis